LNDINATFNGGTRGAISFLASNVDGNGAKGRGCAWASSTSEQDCLGEFTTYHAAQGSEWVYVQGKIKLDAGWAMNGAKAILLLRGRTDPAGGVPDRLYWVMAPGGAQFNIDARNYNSPTWSENPYDYPGVVQRITIALQGSTGSIKVWRNGNLVLNVTGQNIGNSTFDGLQIWAAMYTGGRQATSYDWDWVVWK
jgi:hypothetical protein